MDTDAGSQLEKPIADGQNDSGVVVLRGFGVLADIPIMPFSVDDASHDFGCE